MTLLELLTWTCFALIAYAYLGYPLVIYVLSRLFGHRRCVEMPPDEQLPRLCLLVAAYNEEACIEKRILNALAMDYPVDKLEIVIATDGCTDDTAEIARRYTDRGVRVLEFAQRRGKAVALNAAVPQLTGEIVMFSDANTFTEPQAARNLARWFQNADVDSVCGRLVLTDPESGQNVDSMYWKYETFLKVCESMLGALLGANGGIYAIRRSQYVPIPNGTILDDLIIPLLIKLQNGTDIVYDRRAVAQEETPPNVQAEFHRRSRIGAGGFGSLQLLAGLLNPLQGWVFFTFVSHKLLRWCCPFFLLALLVTSALTWDSPFSYALLLAQVAFYTTSVVTAQIPGQAKAIRCLRMTTMFTSMNGALLLGFCRWVFGTQNGAWRRTARLQEAS